jgi:peptidoglycan hydrolase CwlO-like protein
MSLNIDLTIALQHANNKIDSLNKQAFDTDQVIDQLLADMRALNRRIIQLENPIPDLPTVK